jgi:hypothetical protein
MKKTVKCSGCGKEHEIVVDALGWHIKDVTFKPVESIRDKILREYGKVCNEGRYPDTLYIGKKEEKSLRVESNALYARNHVIEHGITKYLGFNIVELDKDSYFHATSKATE